MDYRIAKQVRSAKFSDLVTANIVQGTSTLGSIRKAISQKAKARATRIKEKFDPLNIVKFMTGGSKLAPAVLGRLLGRSQRDIEYFSGTARLIGGRNTRIGTVDKQGMELGILTDIYKFLSKSYEYDRRQRDLQADFAEERTAEDERRHKELIKAIQDARGVTAIPIKEKDTSGGFMDTLAGLMNSVQNAISSIIKSISDLKNILQLGKLLGILKWFASPVGLALLGITALSTLGVFLADLVSGWLTDFVRKQMPDYSLIDPIEAKNILEKGSERDIEFFAKKKQFGSREKLEEFVKSKMTEAKYAIENVGDLTPEEYIRFSKLAEPIRREGAPQQAEKIIPRDKWPKDQGGPARWDTLFGDRYNPDGKLKSLAPGQIPLLPGIVPSEGRSSMQYDDSVARQTPQGAAFGVRPMGIPEKKSEPPPSISIPAAGSNLAPAVSENRDLQIAQKATPNAAPSPTAAAAVIPAASSVVQRPPIPAVRNLEESFQRMIYNSIRVV